jgi:hypothetical protein
MEKSFCLCFTLVSIIIIISINIFIIIIVVVIIVIITIIIIVIIIITIDLPALIIVISNITLQMDRFVIEAADLGKIYKCRIRHDNSKVLLFDPAWFLDRVEITDPEDNQKYVFHCERWLAKNKEDGKIERSLYVKVEIEH